VTYNENKPPALCTKMGRKTTNTIKNYQNYTHQFHYKEKVLVDT